MKKFLSLTMVLLAIYNIRSQGCSDAGACSIGGLKSDGKVDEYLSVNSIYGLGEQNVSIITPQLEAVFKLSRKSGLQFKFPYVFASGNLGSTNGFGDITAVFTHRYYDKDKWKLGANAGFKIGVNGADKKKSTPLDFHTSNYSLPMPYQTSLGTHDLLIGFDAMYEEKWMLGLAFQMPVYQFNRNGFDTILFNSNETKEKQYFTSNHLFRRPDIVFRADRQFRLLKEKMTIQAGVLPIYHLGHDRFTDTGGVSHAISNSKGLTLNLTMGMSYRFDEKFSVIARYAFPVIVRKVRPDGLTRHYVYGLELRYSF